MSLLAEHAQAPDPAAKIEIPATAFVPCPAARFSQTRVARCPECPHFRGFVDTSPRAAAQPIEFIARYRVFCGHAIARRMAHVEI